jgi:hypothetical protein
MRLARRRARPMIAFAAVAAALAAGGIAYAQIPDPSGVIHGCYAKSGGALRVIDNSVTNCKSTETSLNWNQTGPAGPAGPAGPQGPQGEPGPPATSNWAILNADGTIRASSGVDPSGTGGGAGTYEVDFAPP